LRRLRRRNVERAMRGIKSVEIIDRETLGVRQSVRELMYAARRGQAKVCVVVSR
jgi:hypothetical protein